MPASVRNSVVLPAPLPPTSPSRSPKRSVNDTSRNACTTTRCFASSCKRAPRVADVAAANTVRFRLRLFPWIDREADVHALDADQRHARYTQNARRERTRANPSQAAPHSSALNPSADAQTCHSAKWPSSGARTISSRV